MALFKTSIIATVKHRHILKKGRVERKGVFGLSISVFRSQFSLKEIQKNNISARFCICSSDEIEQKMIEKSFKSMNNATNMKQTACGRKGKS
jgi:hypothetical protein